MSPEEQVIRDWLAGQVNIETGSILPPSRRTSKPLPRRQVVAVVATLIDLLDECRTQPEPAFIPSGPRDVAVEREWRAVWEGEVEA